MIHSLAQSITDWDTLISISIFRWKRRRPLDALMIGASHLGDGYFYAVLGLNLFFVRSPFTMNLLYSALIAFAIELPLYGIIKKTTKRNRPFIKIPEISHRIKPPDKFSFPSGHTAAAFVMATIFASAYPVLLIPLSLIASTIGFSRIYNGVHYTSDVIAGMLLGFVSAEIGLHIIF